MGREQSNFSEFINSLKSAFKLFVSTSVLVGAILYLIFQINTINEILVQNNSKKRKISTLKVENERLEREIKKLGSFSRIEKLAAEKDELAVPKKAAFKILVNEKKYQKYLKKLKNLDK
jgi:cell division protein FtsL